MNNRNIILLSELEHIDNSKRFLDTHPNVREEGYMLITLDAEIEYALAKQGIAFQSAKEYRTRDVERLILAEKWIASIFESKRWSFYTYRGVTLGYLYFQQLQGYIGGILYYTDILSNIVSRHPRMQRLIVFPSSVAPPVMGRCLTPLVIQTVLNAAKNIAHQSGKEILVFGEEALQSNTRKRLAVFKIKRIIFGWGIAGLNAIVRVFRRQQRIRILASDHWGSLAPTFRYLDSAELILIDRQEVFHAGVSNIWKYHMQFLHLDAFSKKISDKRKHAQELFKSEWQSIRREFGMSGFLYHGISLQPILIQALERIMDESVTKTLKDIDDAQSLLARLKPDVVMLRATVSSQTHFSILAQVARSQGIPSIEMQHGLLYFGPGSLTKRHTVEYIGVYGPLVQREMKKAGDDISIPIIIGSPRFDVYATFPEIKRAEDVIEEKEITFLYIAPMVFVEFSTDSYDVVDYFRAIASALRKIPRARAILKLRPGPNRDPFLRATIESVFDGVHHTIAQFEPLTDLFKQADVVISSYSTAALEALQVGKPLVYMGLCPLDDMTGQYHFLPYVREGVMRFASSEKELADILGELAGNPEARKTLSENAASFLVREYAFDGKASERTAAFVEQLAQKES